MELAGGRPGPVAEACDEARLPVPKAVTMLLSRLNQLLGTALSAAVVNDVFERLGMQVSQHEDVFEVTPPSTRSDIAIEDRKSTRLNSSHVAISYAVFCLKKKNK